MADIIRVCERQVAEIERRERGRVLDKFSNRILLFNGMFDRVYGVAEAFEASRVQLLCLDIRL
jgi:hypothetical protein